VRTLIVGFIMAMDGQKVPEQKIALLVETLGISKAQLDRFLAKLSKLGACRVRLNSKNAYVVDKVDVKRAMISVDQQERNCDGTTKASNELSEEVQEFKIYSLNYVRIYSYFRRDRISSSFDTSISLGARLAALVVKSPKSARRTGGMLLTSTELKMLDWLKTKMTEAQIILDTGWREKQISPLLKLAKVATLTEIQNCWDWGLEDAWWKTKMPRSFSTLLKLWNQYQFARKSRGRTETPDVARTTQTAIEKWANS